MQCLESSEHLKRLRSRRGDALDLQPNPKHLEGVRLSLGVDKCQTVVSPSQFGQKQIFFTYTTKYTRSHSTWFHQQWEQYDACKVWSDTPRHNGIRMQKKRTVNPRVKLDTYKYHDASTQPIQGSPLPKLTPPSPHLKKKKEKNKTNKKKH